MIRLVTVFICLTLGTWGAVHADSSDWRTSPEQPSMSASDMQAVGRAVCGDGEFNESEGSLICGRCPEFTGNAGADSGLEIGPPLRGHFSGSGSGEEWIVDTEGCEAHFAGFGGAIFLVKADPKPLPGSPSAVLGFRPGATPSDTPLSLIWYKARFRLNDCLILDGDGARSLLVCNEADMAQGEVIGHISALEVSKRDITRWRLLRWYDNSAANTNMIVSVVPTEMRQVRFDNGQKALHITMAIVETSRDKVEKEPGSLAKTVTLTFLRKGQRLFASTESQQLLGEINLLTGKMLD